MVSRETYTDVKIYTYYDSQTALFLLYMYIFRESLDSQQRIKVCHMVISCMICCDLAIYVYMIYREKRIPSTAELKF